MGLGACPGGGRGSPALAQRRPACRWLSQKPTFRAGTLYPFYPYTHPRPSHPQSPCSSADQDPRVGGQVRALQRHRGHHLLHPQQPQQPRARARPRRRAPHDAHLPAVHGARCAGRAGGRGGDTQESLTGVSDPKSACGRGPSGSRVNQTMPPALLASHISPLPSGLPCTCPEGSCLTCLLPALCPPRPAPRRLRAAHEQHGGAGQGVGGQRGVPHARPAAAARAEEAQEADPYGTADAAAAAAAALTAGGRGRRERSLPP